MEFFYIRMRLPGSFSNRIKNNIEPGFIFRKIFPGIINNLVCPEGFNKVYICCTADSRHIRTKILSKLNCKRTYATGLSATANPRP